MRVHMFMVDREDIDTTGWASALPVACMYCRVDAESSWMMCSPITAEMMAQQCSSSVTKCSISFCRSSTAFRAERRSPV